MRIAINADILQSPRTGIGNYLAGLFGALQARGDIDVALYCKWGWTRALPAAPLPGYSRWARLAKAVVPGAYQVRRGLAQHFFSAGVKRIGPVLYHEPSLWPLEFDGPMVMTIHDLTHVRYPDTQPPKRLKEIERRLHKGLARAGRILVDSAFIGQEVIAHFGLAADKVVVAPLACSSIFVPRTAAQTHATLQRLGLKYHRFFLCVGTLEPRKNMVLALRAHARLPQALRQAFPLVLVGMVGWGEHSFSAELALAVRTGYVRLLGYLGQEELAHVTAGARALVFPSIYEGFGLPALEAMASATPVIVSDQASLPEVVGQAGCVVSAFDPIALSQAMQAFIEDEETWMMKQALGLARASQFSWDRCAHITASTYMECLK